MILPKFNRKYKDYSRIQQGFVNGNIDKSLPYFQNESFEVDLKNVEPFPIYLGHFSNSKNDQLKRSEAFVQACHILRENYINRLERDILLNGEFWYSLIILHFREYVLAEYPFIKTDLSKFKNVLLKKFDWENYIYKLVLAVQYIDNNVRKIEEKERYYRLIVSNLDVYNYIIKYEVFRTGPFLINILDIIDEHGLSHLLKRKIKGREDLGDDERYGRRVIYELNKSYPVLLSPMMTKEELEEPFFKYLSYYYQEDDKKEKPTSFLKKDFSFN